MRRAAIAVAALFFGAATFAQVGAQADKQFLFYYMLAEVVGSSEAEGRVVELDGCSALFRFDDGRCAYIAADLNVFAGESSFAVWVLADVVDGTSLAYVNSVISEEFSDILNILSMYVVEAGSRFVMFKRKEVFNGRR